MKLEKWRKRWIQLLGIVLCILVAIVAGYVICFLAQHLVLLYLTGAAILLFFYRVLLYKKPEQRRKEKAQKQEQRRWKQHRCFPISGRARAAYLILCIEEVLRYYRLDFTRWKRLLEILWDITQTDNVWEWVAYTSNLDPETIASCQDWVEWEEKGDWEEPLPDRYRMFEEEFSVLREEYRALPPLADTFCASFWTVWETPSRRTGHRRKHRTHHPARCTTSAGGNRRRIQWDPASPKRAGTRLSAEPKGQALGIPFQWPSPIRSHLTNTGAVKS